MSRRAKLCFVEVNELDVAMFLCGSGAPRPARCKALAQYVFVACTAACIIIFVLMFLCGSGTIRPACCKASDQYVFVACTAACTLIFKTIGGPYYQKYISDSNMWESVGPHAPSQGCHGVYIIGY